MLIFPYRKEILVDSGILHLTSAFLCKTWVSSQDLVKRRMLKFRAMHLIFCGCTEKLAGRLSSPDIWPLWKEWKSKCAAFMSDGLQYDVFWNKIPIFTRRGTRLVSNKQWKERVLVRFAYGFLTEKPEAY